MKISLKWLGDHLDVAEYFGKANDLAKILTDAGLEVEAVENSSAQFKNVVVGLIVKLDRHPNADRLTVCQVDTGEGQPRQIVCGAKNHKAGDKVVVTLPGAVLPGNFEIKKSKIRDVESLGMLASESELGLKKESEGILILPGDAPVGKPFADYFGLDDVIFEINVSPNRADCLSHLGLARELSGLLNRPLKTAKLESKTSSSISTKKTIALEVKDHKLCPRYAARLISGIKVGPSPAWLKARLESVGMNSINNVVDVTNFIMMDLGQPLHAFDVAALKGGKIIVDRAPHGEKFKTLDGTELKLAGDELTIRDGERAVCLAGVVGGQNSGVNDQTKGLLIESAHFAMDSVRRTARRLGLQTDSAYRFSRGTDPSGVVRALDRACALIQQVAGGDVASDHWDLYPHPLVKAPILVTAEYVAQRLGYPVQEAQLIDWLKRIGCQVAKSGSNLSVTPADFRVDLEQEVDLVEEFGRLNGYSHIPDSLPVLSYAPLQPDKAFLFEAKVADLARGAGFSQCVNFGFTGAKYQSAVLGPVEAYRASGLEMDPQAIGIQNPLNEDLDVMRVSLLPGLLKNVLHNFRHGNSHGRLFETGFVFRKGPEGYLQDARLSFATWGLDQGLWQKNADPRLAFFDLKSRVQSVLQHLLIHQAQINPWTVNPPALLHPSQSATIFIEGRNVGFIGSIHPRWSMGEKVSVPVVIGELDLKALGRGQPRTVKFKAVSKFPSVERDLAFVLPKNMLATEVSNEIKRVSGSLLQSIDIFDVFEGGNLPAGHVSVAYRMIFQDLEGTLNDEKLTSLQTQIVSNVEKKLNVRVR
jgi:phenylalanyl-tRNA synthetase beta chain